MKPKFDLMIVARRSSGVVEAAGWDCTATRKDAREWLDRGLTLELVTADQVEAIEDDAHVFSTSRPIGEVISRERATLMLAESASRLH